jgi:glycosyltransferase involved in cell wall biosynthesis
MWRSKLTQCKNYLLKEKINILFVIDFLGVGGSERHLYYLIKNLNKDKFNCFVLTFAVVETHVEKLRNEGMIIYHVPVKRVYTPNAIMKALKIRKIIKENNIDIVQTFHFKSDTFGTLVSKLCGVSRIISSRRDMGDLKKPRQICLNRLANTLITRYIMVCDAVGERLYRLEGIPRDKGVTIYNGVDLKRFDADSNPGTMKSENNVEIENEDFVVGTTAIFRAEKAYHIFFDGIEKAMGSIKNLKVLVLGGGIQKEYFELYCKERHLKHIVKFMGHVVDVETYLRLMDVFCLVPNKNEGFSNAILEAMATGKPVIATNVGGNAEAVIHNETGLVIPPDNSEKLAQAIVDLYKNPAVRKEMGRKGRKRAEEIFTIEGMVKKHEDLYEEVFNQTGTERREISEYSI